ncbi:DUF1340 domain-containing protein [Streptococcus salivarius]|uniref:DUF1340 domain-containing protein n=1 Tax=Streptococcus salivarius TaxID=1304 RepID=A0A6A8UAU6_STRSL|nr:DUF1340 domain-containing protein [Streptococcus salivarius]MTQ89439.1 DUF1340 domain-containing protein [Streptococcus salivarius]MTR27016.1 DUF1340 domain-containing protein [Streptococcus salivarius]MTR38267.1 DUF1340 domain-containing protein [Streptococcus salivarius]
MSKTYKYSGLTEELYQRLVSEHAELRKAHKKGSYKQHFQKVRQCSEKQAIIILQALNNAVMERARISPQTAERLEGIISDELFKDLQAYLSENYTRGKVTRPIVDTSNAGLPKELFKQFQEEVEELRSLYKNSMAKHIMEIKGCDRKEANRIKDSIDRCYVECVVLTPLKVIQMEGLLSRDLFSKIAKYVLNNYEWPERLDDEVDRIVLKYRTKGELGRKKPSVKRALYTALAMGL